MDYKLVLDIIISVLLIATIAYAIMLNGRLTSLRKNRDEMAKIVLQFNEATSRAELSIPKLKKAAEEAGQALQDRVEKAQALRDDLAFMIERADSMANRLETGVRQARTEAPRSTPSVSAAAAPASGPAASRAAPRGGAALQIDDDLSTDERSEAERELLRALQAVR